MQLIRCTRKLQKEMGLKPSELFPGDVPDSTLGPWHANLIHIARRKCVLFANDKTLFNFIAPDVTRAQIKKLDELFLGYLHPVLAEEGFSARLRERIAAEYAEVAYARAGNKSVLGSMDDLAFHYEYFILSAGGVHSAEVPSIMSKLNRMPMGALEYAYPVDVLRAIYSTATSLWSRRGDTVHRYLLSRRPRGSRAALCGKVAFARCGPTGEVQTSAFGR